MDRSDDVRQPRVGVRDRHVGKAVRRSGIVKLAGHSPAWTRNGARPAPRKQPFFWLPGTIRSACVLAPSPPGLQTAQQRIGVHDEKLLWYSSRGTARLLPA